MSNYAGNNYRVSYEYMKVPTTGNPSRATGVATIAAESVGAASDALSGLVTADPTGAITAVQVEGAVFPAAATPSVGDKNFNIFSVVRVETAEDMVLITEETP